MIFLTKEVIETYYRKDFYNFFVECIDSKVS